MKMNLSPVCIDSINQLNINFCCFFFIASEFRWLSRTILPWYKHCFRSKRLPLLWSSHSLPPSLQWRCFQSYTARGHLFAGAGGAFFLGKLLFQWVVFCRGVFPAPDAILHLVLSKHQRPWYIPPTALGRCPSLLPWLMRLTTARAQDQMPGSYLHDEMVTVSAMQKITYNE